jgi:hypothetical protein
MQHGRVRSYTRGSRSVKEELHADIAIDGYGGR